MTSPVASVSLSVLLCLLLLLMDCSAVTAVRPRHERSPPSVADMTSSRGDSSVAAEPLLLLSISVSQPTPGMPVTLWWLCFYCQSETNRSLTLSTTVNSTVSILILSSAPLNGSYNYTIPTTVDIRFPMLFNVTETAGTGGSHPPLYHILSVALRNNRPSLSLLQPAGGNWPVDSFIPLQWQCGECFQLSTAAFYWQQGDDERLLVGAVPLLEPAVTALLPSDMETEERTTIIMRVDNSKLVASQAIYPLPNTQPAVALSPVPFLVLFINPSVPAPGMPVQLYWSCFFCASSSNDSVSISAQGDGVIVSQAPLNGSLNYSIPTSLASNATAVFTATTSSLSYSLSVRLRAPVPVLTMSQPSGSVTVYQSQGMTLAWTCAECWLLPTLAVTWSYDDTTHLLLRGLPVVDSPITVPVPDEMVAAANILVYFRAELHNSTADYHRVIVRP